VAGVGELEVEADTVLNLLRELQNRFGYRAHDLIFDEKGKIRPYTLVYVNNTLNDDLNHGLNEGDMVLLIPPAGGG
jgi:molybdopterin converting factor small subunit